MSLRALARELELSPATVSAFEHDAAPLTLDRVRRVAAVLSTTVESLVRGEVLNPSAVTPGSGGDWRRYDDLELGAVLEAASRMFVRHGYHAATMRQVAAEAALSTAGVYHHYASKQELIVALLDVTMSEIRWRIVAAREEADTPADGFALMVESLALFHAVRGDLAFLGATEMRALEERDRGRIVALRDEVQHLLDAQVDHCLADGSFSVPRPRVAARAVAAMCTSLPTWFRNNGGVPAEEVARDYAKFAVAMMR